MSLFGFIHLLFIVASVVADDIENAVGSKAKAEILEMSCPNASVTDPDRVYNIYSLWIEPKYDEPIVDENNATHYGYKARIACHSQMGFAYENFEFTSGFELYGKLEFRAKCYRSDVLGEEDFIRGLIGTKKEENCPKVNRLVVLLNVGETARRLDDEDRDGHQWPRKNEWERCNNTNHFYTGGEYKALFWTLFAAISVVGFVYVFKTRCKDNVHFDRLVSFRFSNGNSAV